MIWIKSKIKNLVYFFLNLFSKELENKASVLMYHCVNDTKRLFNVRPRDFEWQMCYLKVNNYNVVSYSELVNLLENKEDIPPKTVILTFDDGFSDNYETVFPLLKKYNFPATIFLTTDFVDDYFFIEKFNQKFKMLTWEQVREMEGSGLVDLQPHTISHPKLAKISKEKARKEIVESKKIVEEKLNKKCDLFAYPYGNYNKGVAEILKKVGFRSSVTVEVGLVDKGSNSFSFPRNFVYLYCGKSEFKSKLNSSIFVLNFLKHKFFGK